MSFEVLLHNRGSDAREQLVPVSGFDTNSMAETIHALVVKLGFERIDLVGHDVGAAVAYAYASTHRDEVALVSPRRTIAAQNQPRSMRRLAHNHVLSVPTVAGAWHPMLCIELPCYSHALVVISQSWHRIVR
jgi:pimeloyl-ACP methyl ester carboxylesterase